jgi:hypothetical protein
MMQLNLKPRMCQVTKNNCFHMLNKATTKARKIGGITCKIFLEPFWVLGTYVAIPPPRIHSPRICMRPSRRRHHRFLFYCCKYFINPWKTWRGKIFICFWLQSQPSHRSFCFCVYSLEQTKQKHVKFFSFRLIKLMNIYFLKLIDLKDNKKKTYLIGWTWIFFLKILICWNEYKLPDHPINTIENDKTILSEFCNKINK